MSSQVFIVLFFNFVQIYLKNQEYHPKILWSSLTIHQNVFAFFARSSGGILPRMQTSQKFGLASKLMALDKLKLSHANCKMEKKCRYNFLKVEEIFEISTLCITCLHALVLVFFYHQMTPMLYFDYQGIQ